MPLRFTEILGRFQNWRDKRFFQRLQRSLTAELQGTPHFRNTTLTGNTPEARRLTLLFNHPLSLFVANHSNPDTGKPDGNLILATSDGAPLFSDDRGDGSSFVVLSRHNPTRLRRYIQKIAREWHSPEFTLRLVGTDFPFPPKQQSPADAGATPPLSLAR